MLCVDFPGQSLGCFIPEADIQRSLEKWEDGEHVRATTKSGSLVHILPATLYPSRITLSWGTGGALRDR